MRETCALWAKCGLVGLMIVAGAATMKTGSVAAQSSDPSALPLLSQSGLEYVGGFRLPSDSSNGEWFSFGGSAVAFNPLGNSLFVSSYHGSVAEVSIPAPLNSSNFRALPVASYLQPFADPTEGHLSDISSVGVSLTSLMVKGNRLFGTASIYYDANNTQRFSHFSRSLQLNQPSFSGWSQVSDAGRTGFVSGWMTSLPGEWQAKLGGTALTGQCCIPIVWRTSVGPAALSFDPAQVGQPTVGAIPLLYYTGDHATLGPWEGSNPTYGATTQMGGMAALAGTRTVLYFGTNGLGEHCYGNGTADPALVGTVGADGAHYCYDPTNSSKSSHAYPYRYQMWAYDMNDFAAVRAGTKQPWEVVPYGVWPLEFPTPEPSVRIGGVGYDAQRQLLYVSQLYADAEGYSAQPVIHVFRVNASQGAASSPAPGPGTVSNVTLTSSKAAPQAPGTAITFTAQPTGGVAPHQYKWLISDGVTSSVAANWTASNQFTWTPTAANSKYVVSVWVRSAGNTADALEASTSMAFPIATPAPATTTAVTLVANRVAPQPPFTAITWTATPVGGVAPHEYKWLVSDGATTTVAANWSTTNSFVWTPSTANANYRVEVWARSAGNTADAKEASASSAFAIATAPATVSPSTPVSSVALNANKAEPQPTGTAITWSAVPSGGTAPFVYKWFLFDGATWHVLVNWTSNASLAWTPSAANANYRVRVWVKAAGNAADQPEAAAEKGFSITAAAAAPVSAVTLTSDKSSPQPAGTMIVFTAQPTGGSGLYEYQWWVFENQQWSAVTPWGLNKTLTWSRSIADPKYQVQVRVRSFGSTSANGEATATMPFVLNNGNGKGK
jgi:hypothetical protein